MKAVAGGHKSLALTLILLGADITEQDQRGRTALMIAVEKHDATFLSRLDSLSQISYEPDAMKRKERLRACPGVERSLLGDREVDLRDINLYGVECLKDDEGENALMKAARLCDWECVSFLSKKLDPMLSQDKRGRTVLMHAVIGDNVERSRWLNNSSGSRSRRTSA